MKKIFRNIALFAATALAAVGCAPEQGEIIDTIELNRALSPLEFKANVIASKGTDVEFSWEVMEGVEKYELQLFAAAKDAEGNTVAPNYDEASPIDTYIVLPEEVPYRVDNLTVDADFYARVRSCKTNLEPSKWVALEEDFSTFAVRSSLNPKVTERGTDYIVVSWDAAEDKGDLTTLRVAPVREGEEVVITLESADKEACSKRVEGLTACTDYRFELVFGKSGSRGYTTGWTRPSDSGFNTVNTVEAIVNAITGTIGDVKLLVEYNDGIPYDLPSAATIQCNLYLVGKGSGDGKKPIISGLDIQPAGPLSAIHLEDLVLDGAVNAVPGSEAKGHILTFTANNSVDKFEIINCEVYGYTKGICYNNVAGANTTSMLMDGVYVHDVNADGKVGGDFIDLRNGEHPSITVKNSTFSMCARTFFRISDSANSGDVLVENCTFNMVTATATSSNNAGIFGIRTKTTPSSITLKNSVFLNELSEGEDQSDASKCFVRLVRNSSDSNAPVCSGNYFYNVGAGWFTSAATTIAGGAFDEAAAVADGGKILTEDPCVNSLANKLYLNTTSDISAKKVGDPRWWNAQQPVIIRATELTLVSEPYVWDFTTKSKFDTETLEKATIIDNVRIYATAEVPAEVVMGEGVKFSKGAMVGAEGEPEYSAVGVLTEGYGAIVVTAQGESGIETMQVLAGGDRYTILADGEPHKVVLGDLAGENNIYVLASSAVTLTKVEWTKDITPDQTVFPLAKPAIILSATSLDEGTAEAVTVSWEAVENADRYVLTGLGQTLEFAATDVLSLTVPAEQVAVLPVGEYPITLTAYPVETSSKYCASETATVTFKIKKVVLGGEVTLKWGAEAFNDIWKNGCAGDTGNIDAAFVTTKMVAGGNLSIDADGFTYDGLQFLLGGGKFKFGENNNAAGEKVARVQFGGTGNTGKAVLIFEAPAAGTLKLEAISSGDSSRPLKVAVDGTEVASFDTPDKTGTAQIFEVDCSTAVKGSKIYIYSGNSGINLFSIEYTYVAAPVEHNLTWAAEAFNDIWKNGCAGDTGNIDAAFVTTKMVAGGNLSIDADGFTYDGLQFLLGGGKFKFGENNNAAGEKVARVQFGGTGNTGKAVLIFEAPAAGTLKLEAISSGDSSRPLKVAVDGTEVASFDTPDKTGTAQIFEVDCSTAVEGSKIYIYSGNSGINLFSINYSYVK